MTQTLCLATPTSSSVTLTSPVSLFSSSAPAPFALQAAPSPAKVRHRYRRETLARYFRIRRGERRECAPAVWGKDSEEGEDTRGLARRVACEEIIKSWQDVGLDVRSSGEPMPRCTAMQLEMAIDSFFGGSAIKKKL